MRFMLMFKPDKPPPPGVHACKENLPEMAACLSELKKAGVVLSTTGLLSSETGARIRLSDGNLSVIDGPFAEAKEMIAGIVIVQVDSKPQAVELAKRFLTIAGGGVGDVVQIVEPAESAA